MNRLFRSQLALAACCFMATGLFAANNNNGVVTQYNLRSQSLNGARKVSGEVPGSSLVHLCKDELYGYFGITPEYDQTFRSNAIAHSLFGSCLTTVSNGNNNCKTSCDKTSLLVQGTNAGTRSPFAIRAEDLYLGENYSGVLTFSPKISNFLIDFQFYLGFGDVCGWNGGYLRLYAPFVHTKWNVNMCERIITPGTTVIEGSFAAPELAQADLLASAEAYFAGFAPRNVTFNANATDANPDGTSQTVVRQGLTAAKIGADCRSTNTCNPCKKRNSSGDTKNGFGEIRAELGWNFWQCQDGHVGFNIQAAAPTGNRPNGEFLFEPIVGNGKHWELGAGVTAHHIWWRSCDEDQHFGIYLDAMVTHLFNSTQCRVFDLNDRPLSRYMLAALHTTDVVGDIGGVVNDELVPATSQFANQFTPVANLTRQKVSVSVGAQGDVALWLNYSACGFSWDLGYNFFGQTCEKIKCTKGCPPRLASEKTWALKGDAHVYGFTLAGTDPVTPGLPYALAVSESQASLICPVVTNNQNASVNNPELAGSTALETNPLFDLSTPPQNQTRLSIQPVFLTLKDVNLNQRSRIMTNKLFTHFQYKWDRECWSPFLGLGGEVEFGNSNGEECRTKCNVGSVNPSTACTTTPVASTNNCKKSCNDCTRIGASQWGIWLKTGVAF